MSSRLVVVEKEDNQRDVHESKRRVNKRYVDSLIWKVSYLVQYGENTSFERSPRVKVRLTFGIPREVDKKLRRLIKDGILKMNKKRERDFREQ